MVIEISVKNKVASCEAPPIVCENSDYTVHFTFDEEWEAYPAKTARFEWNEAYTDVIFNGDTVEMPTIGSGAYIVKVGVYAGDLHTTTPALVKAQASILSGNPAPHPEPEEDIYNQIMDAINSGMLQGPEGPEGPEGPDGFSPSATVERVDDGAVITITDKDGTTIAEVYDGTGGGGSNDHSQLINRDLAAQHTMYSISGLNDALSAKQDTIADLAEIRSGAEDGSDALTAVGDIEDLIPAQATTSNQLADKAFVNSSVQTATSNFRGNWANWAAVPTDPNLYPVDYAGVKTPSANDYMVIVDASDFRVQNPLSGTWRFKYGGTWETDGKAGWNPEYQVNETPMTAVQLAALNSGITAGQLSSIISALADTETWTFTLDDDTTVTKTVVVQS